MPHFLIVHHVTSYPGSQEDWVDIWRELREESQRVEGVTWLQSFFDPERDELFCEWEADELETIKRCFTEDQLEMAPIKSVREIVLFDPRWLDE
jgi:hypothetical protein